MTLADPVQEIVELVVLRSSCLIKVAPFEVACPEDGPSIVVAGGEAITAVHLIAIRVYLVLVDGRELEEVSHKHHLHPTEGLVIASGDLELTV